MKFKVFLLMAITVLLTACPSPDDDFGKLKKDQLIATGGVSDITPFSATIKGSISPEYMALSSRIRVYISDDWGRSWYENVGSLSSSKFEVNVNKLYPDGEFTYYCSVEILGTEFVGETRSFSTPSCNLGSGAVDMGLSVRWRSCDLGADEPYDVGNTYTWQGSNYDIASTELGGRWRLPTKREAQELIDGCEWHLGMLKRGGHRAWGLYVVGPSGGVIFLIGSIYMTSSLYDYSRDVWVMDIDEYGGRMNYWPYNGAMHIRPVCD